ncbi:phage portal protein [Streptomyces sp. NPDC056485]|uniref:phage portal protein n=1 Tax=Streptomyces sp. NPDC056485 TaxID=3345834 RepID=UPI0036836CFA
MAEHFMTFHCTPCPSCRDESWQRIADGRLRWEWQHYCPVSGTQACDGGWGPAARTAPTPSRMQTLMPWIVRIEQAVSTFLLPRGESNRFNADARLGAKAKDRCEAYAVAINNDFMSRDEVGALEDLPPLPASQGAAFVQPLNMAKIGDKEAA